MPTPIELTLSSLLPTVSPLPLELIDLSTSLLAQSRSKTATLKPEEEIARTYACCHIACQRLGHRLALEIAPPAPPVKPRVYQKLHAYFNSVLATPKPGRKKAIADESRRRDGGRRGDSAPTMRKRQAEEKVTTPASTAKRLKRNEETRVPNYVMPMIRHLCREFDAPDVAPHVYAGMESMSEGGVFEGHGNPFLDSAAGVSRDDMLPPQLVGVFHTVYAMMYPAQHAKAKKLHHTRMTEAFMKYCQENIESLPFHRNEDGVVLLPTLGSSDNDCGHPVSWDEMEWFQNIPTADDLEDGADAIPAPTEAQTKTPIRREKRTKTSNPDADGDVGAAGLLPGLGTMFQPAIDWLSDERRAQYAQWRKDIAKQMALTQQRA